MRRVQSKKASEGDGGGTESPSKWRSCFVYGQSSKIIEPTSDPLRICPFMDTKFHHHNYWRLHRIIKTLSFSFYCFTKFINQFLILIYFYFFIYFLVKARPFSWRRSSLLIHGPLFLKVIERDWIWSLLIFLFEECVLLEVFLGIITY